MHCVSLAIISRLSRFHPPTVGTNWPILCWRAVKHHTNKQTICCTTCDRPVRPMCVTIKRTMRGAVAHPETCVRGHHMPIYRVIFGNITQSMGKKHIPGRRRLYPRWGEYLLLKLNLATRHLQYESIIIKDGSTFRDSPFRIRRSHRSSAVVPDTSSLSNSWGSSRGRPRHRVLVDRTAQDDSTDLLLLKIIQY